MRELTVHKIDCFETEDFGGQDELRMEIIADHKHTQSLQRNIREGNIWNLNRQFFFNDQVVIKLIDEDHPDRDDFLGSITIGQTLRNRHRRDFKEDGALYRITYSVADALDNTDPSRAAVDRFKKSSTPGLWPNIANKRFLAHRTLMTLVDPFRVNQERTFLCGPAVLAFELARKKPLTYVELVRNLYERGRFTSRTKEIVVSRKTMQSTVPEEYAPDHWVVLSSLRDAENALFSVTDSSVAGDHQEILKHINAGVTSFTSPWELEGWTKELLGYNDVSFTSSITSGEINAMREGVRAIARGGVAFFLIDSAMVGNPAKPIGHPDHWITFLGNQNANQTEIWFDCYTFGRRQQVRLPIRDFEKCMYGVVTGRSPA